MAIPSSGLPLRALGLHAYELPKAFRDDMRVPVRVIADPVLLAQIQSDRSLEQLVNVATLPGVTRFAVGMPDMHEGYGFPVGGVAATVLPHGVISPGGIGFDINCGVRLLASQVDVTTLGPHLEGFVHELSRSIPTGYGRHGALALSESQLNLVLEQGCHYLIKELGKGEEADLMLMESLGFLSEAKASAVSRKAKERGISQLGTLGGGNHFLEVQKVEKIFHDAAAHALGLFEGQVTVLIHTGSRGLGHQVCTDYLKTMDESSFAQEIQLPDRQLACAPFDSKVGQAYFQAMNAAANFAFCNRQMLTHLTRGVLKRVSKGVFPSDLRLVYDVAHNIAKVERYGSKSLCVHRKGATRALGPSHSEVPFAYREVGQPVFIPGSMGSASYVLVGTDASEDISFSSSCHGAGRVMSRGAAKRHIHGQELRSRLERQGIVVRCPSNSELAEEAPEAYKDVDRVVEVVAHAGIAQKVARLVPLGVLKG